MGKFIPKPPAPPPAPKPFTKPQPPTPPAASTAALPKAEAYTDAKKKKSKALNQRANLQIPLVQNQGGSGVNTNQ